mgnify:CR=1 FL=1
MKTHKSNTHYAELSNNGILNIFTIKGKTIQEVSFEGPAIHITEHTATSGAPVLRELLNIMDNFPVLSVAFAGNDIFHVDYELGTQRWKGTKTLDELHELLIDCNFTNEDINSMTHLCTQTTHTILPKVG